MLKFCSLAMACLDRTDEPSCHEVLLAHSGSLLESQALQAFAKETEAVRFVLVRSFSSDWFDFYFQTGMPFFLGMMVSGKIHW